MSSNSVRGKTVVVTGAGSGIGRALAVELSERGARVAGCDVSETGLKETAAQCRGEMHTALVDVGDGARVKEYASEVARHFGTAHQIYNNAGRPQPVAPRSPSSASSSRASKADPTTCAWPPAGRPTRPAGQAATPWSAASSRPAPTPTGNRPGTRRVRPDPPRGRRHRPPPKASTTRPGTARPAGLRRPRLPDRPQVRHPARQEHGRAPLTRHLPRPHRRGRTTTGYERHAQLLFGPAGCPCYAWPRWRRASSASGGK